MKTAAIIQVRMKSGRLPGKALLSLAGKPCLWWVVTRACLANEVDEVIIATTADISNDPIEEFYDENREYFSKPVQLYRYWGKEDDVIGRVYQAAKTNRVEVIIDITNDCPLIGPIHIDYLVREYKKLFPQVHYISNCIYRTFPDGLDLQVYHTEHLRNLIDRYNPQQHCGWNFIQHKDYFRCFNVSAPNKYNIPDMALTLDTPEDYKVLSVIFEKLGGDIGFKPERAIDYFIDHPELQEINNQIIRKLPEEG